LRIDDPEVEVARAKRLERQADQPIDDIAVLVELSSFYLSIVAVLCALKQPRWDKLAGRWGVMRVVHHNSPDTAHAAVFDTVSKCVIALHHTSARDESG
jgi:hypothetical protein